ncbi:chemotaxis protein CheB [Hymenobacter glacieicola]|uniref:protein-glutamate methylesterase n=1 Tax=Hymenobacter glacieicola TaxID=1562124 RepID=A0ABQ1WT82_9BACT|nr:chemotaxis protein CheB [Hymenobacter glacieicola]GGG42441.1 chemotaxis response regulator protein-glutamate methylesterase of group 2 operon [Hymenobacter glacieicola]
MSALVSPFTLLLGNLPTFVRSEVTRLLHTDPELEMVGAAVTTDELPTLARRLRPGVVVISDDQLLGLEQLQRHFSVPVLLYSTQVPLPGMLREATRLGVYDYIIAPPGAGSELIEWRLALRRKLLAARPSIAPVSKPEPSVILRRTAVPLPPRGVVVIGGSTGGAPAVETVLRELPLDFPWAVLVAVHLPELFTDTLVERLRRSARLPVMAATSGMRLEPGRIVVAPGGRNLVVKPVMDSPWVGWQTDFVKEASLDVPSVDILMHSIVGAVGRNVVGVILTGLGQDGTAGAQAIRQQGGTVVAQDEASSAVFGMPKSVIQAGLASVVLPLPDIADFLVSHVQSGTTSRRGRSSVLSQPVQAQ